ncbi:Six-hairpin glycosidase-like protein [Desarmillaria tabescens]|uniref:Six-hairpin glycosidase-like protein n=1 Tax=Armillaria tabescens TaxID=1929756 RepID=A0AA39JZB9_ARMTA|nr:Six-hairpin glycosidase-like protein [Desarmillaria tabescens]KAK0451437.1 Six-hairpin glycosidase-like protein [Desarmillaria tabescens]
MTDPSGRSSPGDINNLLIWQQPHPLIFAQYEYRASPTMETLRKWEDAVRETANWMADFAWYNESTGVYDLGPPLYDVSEDSGPNVTVNPAFELAYWRLGLGYAEEWMKNLGEEVPSSWTVVKDNLASLPVNNGTYKVYETIGDDFWTDPAHIFFHPTLVGLYGWLPETEGLNLTIAKATAEKVREYWIVTYIWGWDFSMLAMSSARNGEAEDAVDWLLHPHLNFDDVGMPLSNVRVATPYFPGAGGLLYAVVMMAGGWDGSEGDAPGFPKDSWVVRYEGLSRAL